MKIELQTLRSGYDRQTCWVHARAGVIPAASPVDPPAAVVTMQKLRLTGSDVFYALHDMRSDDGGRTWSDPTEHRQTLGRRSVGDGVEEGVSDFTPAWHAATGVLLGTGHTVRYRGDTLEPQPRPRSTIYSTYDPDARLWSAWRTLEMPDGPKFFSEGAGSTQRVDLPGGDILLPIYFKIGGSSQDEMGQRLASTVLRCAFDGKMLRYIEHGTELSIDRDRGLYEPSLARAAGRYFLTLRNDHAGHVAASDDGLHFGDPRPWTFDDGADLGNYNTQQHWVTHGDDLYLVYTRRGADNDHIFRHRAPLFIAQVDTDRLRVIRDTERVVIPERGAKLGNFGVTQVSVDEAWVTAAEVMQAMPPDYADCRRCEAYGSDGSVFLARVRFE